MSSNGQPPVSLPSAETIVKAAKLSLKVAKPLDFYFYEDSCRDGVCILRDGDEQIIYKNDEERTSPIVKCYKSETVLIVLTENSIYIVNAETPVRDVNDTDA